MAEKLTGLPLFLEASQRSTKQITSAYSTSFSLGILALGKKLRAPIRNIYAFVRCADEIVDTFHNYDKARLLNDFRCDTYEALLNGISYNPILHAFQQTCRQYNIDTGLIDSFLNSMEMDLTYRSYKDDNFEKYIYGSAEVVGLMCLKVFCEGNTEKFNSLVEPARKLGAAFQKINFLRDMKSDYVERGRIYFPHVDFYGNFDSHIKQQIEQDIRDDFGKALDGIRRLPVTSRWGVYISYIYFYRLLKKINRTEPKKILEQRIRVKNTEKLLLLATSYLRFKFNRI